jgi:hypothetical protein
MSRKMVEEFQEELKKTTCPWNENLFKSEKKSNKLQKEKDELFHKFVTRGVFASKRERPNFVSAISFLCTRVKEPTQQDRLKLKSLIEFLNNTKDDTLTIKANNYGRITWHLDAAFGVHKDMRSHTGAV